MATSKPTHDFKTPNWTPLQRALPDEQVGMFMWMHTCVYDDGVRLEAYKHRITRQYLILDEAGNAHVPGEGGWLERLPIGDALDAIGDELERLGWPRSATVDDQTAHLERRRAAYARHHPRRLRR